MHPQSKSLKQDKCHALLLTFHLHPYTTVRTVLCYPLTTLSSRLWQHHFFLWFPSFFVDFTTYLQDQFLFFNFNSLCFIYLFIYLFLEDSREQSVQLCTGVSEMLARGRDTCLVLKTSIDGALSTLIGELILLFIIIIDWF